MHSVTLDDTAVRGWCRAAADDLFEVRAAIDALNVFPVADADTGTNLHLTMVAAADAGIAPAAQPQAAWAAVARAAMLGAHGNSGVILSQLLRGLAEYAPTDGSSLAAAFEHAAAVAYEAVGDPVEGTMLTAARAAAEAAAAVRAADVATVAAAAADGAWQALLATPGQLSTLAEAGVVDAGAAGLVVVLDALAHTCAGEPGTVARHPRVPAPEHGAPVVATGTRGPAYEVMYLLDAAAEAVAELRARLAELGDSLVVVGGDGIWNVHVHVDDVGAAVEAGLAAGRPHRLRVTYLLDAGQAPVGVAGRCAVAVVPTARLGALFEDSGAVTVGYAGGDVTAKADELCAVVTGAGATEVVLLPGDPTTAPVVDAAAVLLRAAGIRVAAVPARSAVQSLAALAVHQPERPYEDDVVAMAAAAVGTRYAEVPVTGGDGRGRLVEAVRALLAAGAAELVTVLGGEELSQGVVDTQVAELNLALPELETTGYEHVLRGSVLLVGVE